MKTYFSMEMIKTPQRGIVEFIDDLVVDFGIKVREICICYYENKKYKTDTELPVKSGN